MRAPTPSEPKSTFPTYQVPQMSAMRGSAPPVQVARATWGGRADPPSQPSYVIIQQPLTTTTTISTTVSNKTAANHLNKNDDEEIEKNTANNNHNNNNLINNNNDDDDVTSVINGSSCRWSSYCLIGNSNISRMQSVTENCLLNSVTVPKIQRNDHYSKVAHNNYNNININNNNIDDEDDSDKLVCKFGALPLGRDIPNQKSDDLEVLDDDDDDNLNNINNNKNNALKNLTNNNNNNSSKLKTTNNDEIIINNNDETNSYSVDYDFNNDDYYNYDHHHINDHDNAKQCDDESKLLVQRTIYHTPLRLRGGGESSINTGTSGWGTPPSQQASNNNANNTSGWGTANPANQSNAGTQQWNNNANRPPTSGPNQDKTNSNLNNSNGGGGQQQPQGGQQQQTPTSQSTNTWGQQTGSAASVVGGGGGGGAVGGAQSVVGGVSTSKSQPIANANPATPTTSTKQQLEQLNNMREAIFSQDGWGGQHVNQDTNWDIPGSPEPSIKMDSSGPPPWKPAVNNGTDLWEANLRNGGQPPPQPQQKTPWGHTPSTNIGGTWGEDDDTDSSNVWTGVPSGGGGAQQQWGGNANSGAAMWGAGPKKDTEWGGNPGGGGAGAGSGNAGGNPGGWGDPRAADPRANNMDMRPDLADMRRGGGGAGNGGGGPNANLGSGGGAAAESIRLAMDPREQIRLPASDMRGDPRGITGRLNGAATESFWPHNSPAAQHMHHQNKMPVGPGNGAGGWEEPSPPTQRRNMPNYDDGTSLWGNPQQGASMGRGNSAGPPGMVPSGIKRDGSVWCHGRNGSWDEPNGPTGGGGGGWDEQVSWNKQKMAADAAVWRENELDWGHKAGGKPPLSKDMIWSSKQFKELLVMGFKREEAETCLRRCEMNWEDTLEMLTNSRNPDAWRNRHDDHYDHQQFSGRFPTGPPGQMTFPPNNNTPNLLNNMNSGGPNNSLINSISPAGVQKMLTQSVGGGNSGQNAPGGGNHSQFGVASAAVAVAGRNLQQPQSQPSTQQLRMLVQQIQMAVQAGYLNHQILNQPLAPQTLMLLNQLLNQIKTLQQLMNQQQLAQQQCINGKPNQALLQCSVLITKTKQQISNLQNQIAAQQAIYVKQQNHGSIGGGSGGPNDLFKTTPMHDSINALQNNFTEMGLKEVTHNSQSRLNQWIKADKEEGGEFSRAPGSSSKPLATSPNMNPLGPDGLWSSGRTGDGGWPDSGGNDSCNDAKDTAQWPTPAQPSLTDLVPEFEPGKPWKGNQIKIEDDPSITPGSVVRSSLSIATIKDTEIFNMNPNKSPPTGDSIQPLSLTSSTWSFNPPSSSTSSAFTSNLGELNSGVAVTSELWGAPQKSRGPPPGLSNKGTLNGWSNNLGGGGGGSSAGIVSSAGGSWGGNSGGPSVAAGRSAVAGSWGGGGGTSPWLLLRNLTAQIDGSTLRTLCMQHGPLQTFHLHLHQGFALAKYSSREEATKAQTALNNCVLGNTTILAENPSEWDATALLQQVASQQNSSGGWRGAAKQPSTGGDTWSTGWSNSQSSTSLWGSSALDTSDPARATPSSLNSFLPGDLLGGESM